MAGGARTIAVEYTGDASDLQKASKQAASSVDDVNHSSKDLGETFEKTSGHSAALAGGFGDLGGALSGIPGPIGTLGSGMEMLAPLIMGVTGAMDLATLGSGALSVASTVLSLAMAALPFILIALAIAAFVAGLIWAWNNVDWFREGIQTAFGFVLDVIQDVFGWVRDNWPLLLAIITGPIGLAVYLISKYWDDIKGGASAVVDWITGEFDSLVSFITGLPGRLASAGAGMWDFIKNEFRSIINTVIGWWNNLSFPTFTLPKVDLGPLGSIGGQSFGGWDLPNITPLRTGGYVPKDTLALIHAGETVVPFGETMGSTTIVLKLEVPATANPAETGRAVAGVLRSYFAAGGRLAIP